RFLEEVQPKADARRFLHQWKGLSLTGDVTEQRLCVFWGKGKNGKSVFEDTHAFVAGDYCETVPIETFLSEGKGRNAGQATPDLAILPGVRMLRTSEPKRNAALDEGLIKLATGGEPIQARHLNRDYFKFYPQFKLTISGNYRPKIEGADEGIWRRMILVPWTYTVPKDKQDKTLTAKLRGEASGILNRVLDGLRDWMGGNGLAVPDDADAATREYRSDSDPLGRFLEACTEPDPQGRVQSSTLHAVFCAWADANGSSKWSGRGFSLAMSERGFHKKQSDVMWWLGLKLVKFVNDFVDESGKPRAARRDDEPGEGAGGAAGDDEIGVF
ncbi:MAG: phage/plasmid primase, P4 family, partial [Pseudorhodoplanes sp.]